MTWELQRKPGGGAAANNVTGTFATMAATNPATYNGTEFNVTDYGQRGLVYIPVGSNWRLKGMSQGVYLLPAPIGYVAPDTAVTASQTNGGNTQVTAALHLLTTTPAVGAYVNVTAWGGGAPVATTGLKKILSVDDVNNYTLDVPFNAANGTPTITLKNVQVTLITFAIPPLLIDSRFRAWPQWTTTNSTNTKRVKIILGTTELFNLNNNTTNVTLINHGFGFSNYNSLAVQHSFFGLSNGIGFGASAGTSPVVTTENTANSLNVRCDVLPAVANELISLDGLDAYLII